TRAKAEVKHSTTCSRATPAPTTASKLELFVAFRSGACFGNSSTEQTYICRTKRAYSQCDHAFPCSSCFFLASASMRRRSEHSLQIVASEALPHILQTCCACSGLESAASPGMTFIVASLTTHAEAWASFEARPVIQF